MTRQKLQYAKKISKEFDIKVICDDFFTTTYHGNKDSLFCYDFVTKRYINLCLYEYLIVNRGLAISPIPSRKAFSLYRNDPENCIFRVVTEDDDYYDDYKDLMIY